MINGAVEVKKGKEEEKELGRGGTIVDSNFKKLKRESSNEQYLSEIIFLVSTRERVFAFSLQDVSSDITNLRVFLRPTNVRAFCTYKW